MAKIFLEIIFCGFQEGLPYKNVQKCAYFVFKNRLISERLWHCCTTFYLETGLKMSYYNCLPYSFIFYRCACLYLLIIYHINLFGADDGVLLVSRVHSQVHWLQEQQNIVVLVQCAIGLFTIGSCHQLTTISFALFRFL